MLWTNFKQGDVMDYPVAFYVSWYKRVGEPLALVGAIIIILAIVFLVGLGVIPL
jgi:hypothetical protein